MVGTPAAAANPQQPTSPGKDMGSPTKMRPRRLSLDLDCMEKGECTEVVADDVCLRPCTSKWNKYFVRIASARRFVLCDDDNRPLLSATVAKDEISFSLTSPDPRLPDEEAEKYEDEPPSPCAQLSYDEAMKVWSLHSSHCQLCDSLLGKYSCFSPHEASSQCWDGRRQCLGRIRHTTTAMEAGREVVDVKGMSVTVPAVDSKAQVPALMAWCPRTEFDMASNPAWTVGLRTRPPAYNKEARCMTLAFLSEEAYVVAHENFLMETTSGSPILQFGAISSKQYCMLVRSPLTPLQAFAFALSFRTSVFTE